MKVKNYLILVAMKNYNKSEELEKLDNKWLIINEKKIKIGDLILNYNQLSVIKGEKNYQLAQKEFYLLYKLLSTPNTIFTRQELMEEIWGLENESDFRTIDVHIKRIREKLEDVDEFEIVTVRGIGYKSIIKGEN